MPSLGALDESRKTEAWAGWRLAASGSHWTGMRGPALQDLERLDDGLGALWRRLARDVSTLLLPTQTPQRNGGMSTFSRQRVRELRR